MKQIIILFEFQLINIPKQVSFQNMIRRYGKFAFLTNNACIIWTESTVVMVRDNLLTGLGLDDKLFVSEITAPAAWTTSISKDVSEYIVNNLKA